MAGHSLDAQPFTPLLELGRPVGLPHGDQVREQGTRTRPPQGSSPSRCCRCAGAHAAGLLAVVDEAVPLKIEVFGVKVGEIRLRAAQEPAQLVEIPALRVALPGNDAAVLVPPDGVGFLVLHLGEFLFRPDRHRQPAPVQGVVLVAPQVDVGGGAAGAQRGHEIIRQGGLTTFCLIGR